MRLFLILFSKITTLLMLALMVTLVTANASALEGDAGDAKVSAEGDRVFDPFLFNVLGDCQHRGNGTAFFRTTTNVTYPAVGQDAQGRDIVIYIRLNLLQDHTYWGQYSEDVLVSKSGSVTELQSTYFAELNGGWQIAGDKLLIDHLGFATMTPGAHYYPKADFKITSRLHDPRAVGQMLTIAPVTTDVGPHGESAIEYCNLK